MNAHSHYDQFIINAFNVYLFQLSVKRRNDTFPLVQRKKKEDNDEGKVFLMNLNLSSFCEEEKGLS